MVGIGLMIALGIIIFILGILIAIILKATDIV